MTCNFRPIGSPVFSTAASTRSNSRAKDAPELFNQLRGMLAMEPVPPSIVPSGELPEDTPDFLNPEALKSADERPIDVTTEEDAAAAQPEPPETGLVSAAQLIVVPEKMEEVLNSRIAFIGGLLEMATGRKLEPSSPDGRMLHVDPTSGKVTLKFKLPGFGSSAPI